MSDRRGFPLIIGLCVVRNEGDILEQVLRHAAPLYDLLLVLDVASDDETPGVIARVAREFGHLVPMGRAERAQPSEAGQRALWRWLRPHVPPGTWFAFVDGDEFAAAEPRSFVEQAEREGADHVQGAFATFRYMREDAEQWRTGGETLADRARPIEERRRWYIMDVYSTRLFREDHRLRWLDGEMGPGVLVRPHSRRLPYRHYQFRDPPQIELRQASRRNSERDDAHRQLHPHWDWGVEDVIVEPGDPRLRRFDPRDGSLYVDPGMEPLWVGNPWVRLARRLKRWMRASRPVGRTERFGEIDPLSVLSRAVPPRSAPHDRVC